MNDATISIPPEPTWPTIKGRYTTPDDEYNIEMYFIQKQIVNGMSTWIRSHARDIIVGGDTDSIYIKKPKTLRERFAYFMVKRRVKRLNKDWPDIPMKWTETTTMT